jgi:cytochrome c oxidase subunit 2
MSKNSSFFPKVLRSPRSVRRYFVAGLSIFALTGLTGCDTHNFGLPSSNTEQGDSVVELWLYSLYAATALGVIVLALLLYSMIRHRRRNNELPHQTEGNVKLEVTYTIIPLIIVTVLFFYALRAQDEAVALEDPDVVVDVTGYQWNWIFEYPGKNVTVTGGIQDIEKEETFPEILVPVNERVRFNLHAADVNHAFFVPDFLTKRDLIPGVRNAIEVTPDKTGTFVGHCAELCGTNHAYMNFRVKVVEQPEYDRWLQDQAANQSAQAPSSINSSEEGRSGAGGTGAGKQTTGETTS